MNPTFKKGKGTEKKGKSVGAQKSASQMLFTRVKETMLSRVCMVQI